MKIGVDAAALGVTDDRLKVGVYQMAKSLFEELVVLDTKNTYFLYSFYPIEKNLLKSFGKNVKNVVVKPVRGWTKIWLPLQLLKDKPDVFVGLNQFLPLKFPLQTYKTVVVVHDVLFEEYPRLYPGSYRKLHTETKVAVRCADTILVPSRATKKDLEKYYKIPKEKIVVNYEGARKFPNSGQVLRQAQDKNSEQSRTARMTASPYFLFVGALKPQKNVPRLLKAFSKISNIKYPISNIQLLIVGGDKWMDREIDTVFTTLPEKTRKRIHFLGTVDDATIAELYKHAIAFVSPSLSEGFGLTFLEAMSFGTPVIGPKSGAVPEVVGNAGILVDPTKEKDITKAMEAVLNDKIRHVYTKNTVLQARKFSWKNFAIKFLENILSLYYNTT